MRWDLKELFSSEELFYEAIHNLKEELVDLKEKNQEVNTSEELYELLNKKWELEEKNNQILIYGSLRYYQNVESDQTKEMKSIAESLNTQVHLALHFVDEFIIQIGRKTIETWLDENEKLKLYQTNLLHVFYLQEHLPNEEDANVKKESQDNIQSLVMNYHETLKSLSYGTIDVNGKEVELTGMNVGKYLLAKDRDTRKQTFAVVNQAYLEQADLFAHILNTIVQERKKIKTLEKFNSVSEMALSTEEIKPEIVQSLIDCVNKNLEVMQKYYCWKMKYLDIQEPHAYDLQIPIISKINRKYTLEEAREIILNALKPLGEEYVQLVQELLDNGHVDAELREEKHQSITFSWSNYSFLNFRGSYIDLKNLIHELGHIVNATWSKQNQAYLYEDSSIFIGETASLVNEILLNKYLYEHALIEEEKLFYLSKEIENFITQVFKQTMYTEFENDLYNHSEEWTCENLGKTYEQLYKKYYGETIHFDETLKVEWAKLGHLFRHNYYVYQYATGLLIANVVVHALLDTNNKQITKESYYQFLKSGSSKPSLELLKELGIDFENSVLLDESFSNLKQNVKKISNMN